MLFGSISKYFAIGASSLVLVLTVGLFLLYQDNQNKAEKIVELKTDLKTQKENVKLLTDLRLADQKAINDLYLKNKEHELEANANKQELERAKQKKSAVLGRPTLVEKMANRATKKVFDEIECVTGNCEE